MSLDASSACAWGPSLDPCLSSSPWQCSRPCAAVTAHSSRSAHPRALRPPLGMHSKRSQEQHALEEVLRGLHSACFHAGASAHGVILLCFHNRFLAPGPDQGQGALPSGMHAFHGPVLWPPLRVLILRAFIPVVQQAWPNWSIGQGSRKQKQNATKHAAKN